MCHCVAAGGVIILTNTKTILEVLGFAGSSIGLVALVLAVLWVSALVFAVRDYRRVAGETDEAMGEAIPAFVE